MNRYRILAGLLVVLGLMLAGCGGGAEPPAAEESAMPAEAPAMAEESAAMDEGPMVEFTQQVVQYNTIADYGKRHGQPDCLAPAVAHAGCDGG